MVLIAASAVSLIPTIYMVDISLRDSAASFAPVLIAPHPILSNYATVLGSGRLGRFFVNSVAVAAGSVVLTLVCAVALSFAIARLKSAAAGSSCSPCSRRCCCRSPRC